MALENLKNNIRIEKNLIKSIFDTSSRLEISRQEERKIFGEKLKSDLKQLKIINNSIPEILNAISIFSKIDNKEEKANKLTEITFQNSNLGYRVPATIEKGEEGRFLEELRLSKKAISRLRKNKVEVEKFYGEYKKPGIFSKISNRFFFKLSGPLVEGGKFKEISSDLRKANLPYLTSSYLSVIFFSTLLASILGLLIFAFIFFLDIKLEYPFIELATITLASFLKSFSVVIIFPVITFLSFYYYPYAERIGRENRINQEIPFVAIHMSAISGSGIEPTQIFKIIALSNEYPYTSTEIKKIINQVNFYGYDLLTALKNTARETSSRRLSELLNGIATTIAGGSDLSEFFDKRSETLLFDYKLEREKQIKSAETFMDIYIGMVIAAPLIITLLLLLMSISGMGIGLGLGVLTFIIIMIVSLINILFMVFLQLSQPTY